MQPQDENKRGIRMARRSVKIERPRILVVTPEITYLPSGMGNMADHLNAKAGGLAGGLPKPARAAKAKPAGKAHRR